MACVLFSVVLWAVVYGRADSTRQEAILILKSGSGASVTVAFSLPFPARRCRTGLSFHYYCLFFKKKKKGDLHFVICSMWVVLMFFHGQKKQKAY